MDNINNTPSQGMIAETPPPKPVNLPPISEDKDFISTNTIDKKPFYKNKQVLIYIVLAVIILGFAVSFAKYYQLYRKEHAIVLNKSNCDKCQEVEPCPECSACEAPVAATPSPSTSTKKTTKQASSSQEAVLAPPAPPSD
jgi:hypothetical protein